MLQTADLRRLNELLEETARLVLPNPMGWGWLRVGWHRWGEVAGGAGAGAGDRPGAGGGAGVLALMGG